MTRFSRRPARVGMLGIVASVWLAACGGGSSPHESPVPAGSQDSGNASHATPARMTMADYSVQRLDLALPGPTPAPNADVIAAALADNRHLASVQLLADLERVDTAANAVVVPPLTQALVRSLAAASAGTSRGELAQRFDLVPAPAIAAQQTGRVGSQWWVERGQLLQTQFLRATDSLGPVRLLASWSGAETGFGDGSADRDVALGQALGAAGTSVASLKAAASIRVLAAHSLAANLTWERVDTFDGVFDGAGDLAKLTMIRLTAGVGHHEASDFGADRVRSGDMALVSLRPASGSLRDFAAGRLETALGEVIGALQSGRAWPAGEMVLPTTAGLALPLQADAPLRNAGVGQVFDEVHADLKNLDGVGGTYAQARASQATLGITTQGLALQSSTALAFTWSPKNVNGGTAGGGLTTVGNYSGICAETLPVPDLRSFFLALVDAQGWVVALAAVQAPAVGMPIRAYGEPGCYRIGIGGP